VTSFLDGPAARVSLTLRRAPWLLRVVHAPSGEWDALDQLDDEPKPEEQVAVYYRATVPTQVHVDYVERGRRRGAWYECADYRVLPEQPDETAMRSTAAWRQWCEGPGREALCRVLKDHQVKPALNLQQGAGIVETDHGSEA
jgi:hypothetical protein